MITLRDLRDDDQDRLFAWRNQPDVARYMYDDRPIPREAHARWFAGLAGDATRRYWIVQLDGEDVGLGNLAQIDLVHRRASTGHYLAAPAARGRGLGTWLLRRLLDEAIDGRGLERVTGEVLAFNAAGLALHERVGFVREGVLRQHLRRADGVHDVVLFGILADEWRAARPAVEARLRAKGVL